LLILLTAADTLYLFFFFFLKFDDCLDRNDEQVNKMKDHQVSENYKVETEVDAAVRLRTS
jgi:hypothetical protein